VVHLSGVFFLHKRNKEPVIVAYKGLTLRLTGFVTLFILSHFSHHLLTALVIPMLPFIRDTFALSYTGAGLVAAAFNFSNGLGQLPAGWLADKAGPRNVMTIGLAGVALAGALVGISSGLPLLIVFLVLMGLAGGGYHPAAPPLIIGAVGQAHRGKALGFHVIGGSLSHFISPVIGISLAVLWGWRGAFLGTALPVFTFGIFFYIFLGKISIGAASKPSETAGAASELPDAPAVTHIHASTAPLREWKKNLRLIAFLALTSTATSFGQACITFSPMVMLDFFHVSEKAAALTLSVIYSAGFWVAPISGFVSDRVGRVSVLVAMSLLLIPVIGLVTLVPYGLFTYILMMGYGVVLFARMPVSEAFIIETVSTRKRSTVLGIYYAAGMVVGATLTPLIGMGIDRYGFQSALTVTALIYSALVTLFIFLLGISSNRAPRNVMVERQ
jgi:MFS family permease